MDLGVVMLDLSGATVSPEDRDRLEHPLTGGVILFSRNFETRRQIEELVATIHALRTPPLLVAVDHEGGRVQRFRDGFTVLPAARRLGLRYDHSAEEACTAARSAGRVMAAELRAIGIDFSFAPVLDIDRGVSEVIGDRAFHHNPDAVVELAGAYIQGMNHSGMAAVGKHYPGHGSVAADSHTAAPVDERPYEEIAAADLAPFARLSAGLGGIMPAHVVYSACDPLPAGFSTFWMREVLRKRLSFDGAVFSDDLSMAGAAVLGDMPERAEAALAVGCDLILICNDSRGAERVLDQVRVTRSSDRQRRLAAMRGKGSRQAFSADAQGYAEAKRVLSRIA